MPIKAKERPTRTRTKKVSNRPPIRLSKIAPTAIDLRDPANAVITCEDCGTECPITGMQGGSVQKLVPHHTGQAHVQPGIRCRGSNRQILFDITIPEWWQARADAAREAANRRAARQFCKPLPAPAAPVARIHAGVTLETARRAYLAHIEECVLCGTGQHCTRGGVLAHRYVLVRNEEPARRKARTQSTPAARKAQWSERGGETVETANNQCRPRLDGAISDLRGPQVPTEPLRVNPVPTDPRTQQRIQDQLAAAHLTI
ncbi:hypothetical protein [Streptomyces albus]|uniref:Uncharacterized protein n=1 Tax=Streptomyces albus TaxID=1888 RepID=A0A8H1LB91_9ACTN|nr:hypothetical protein [Streptomyces albus]TGG78451.1 hypothetical protein D8771_24925 [Streptomyces albus]UVN59474.1 hypothetical protein NR995_33635 [Streptomyces albus]